MANEATVFSLTTTEMATSVADEAGGKAVDISTENAAAMTASVDLGLYYLKAAYEGADGRSSDRARDTHLACACQSSRRQQPRCGGKRDAHLFNEDGKEQNQRPISREKVERFTHEFSLERQANHSFDCK